MSESKHTPGPWQVCGTRHTGELKIGRDARLHMVGPDGDAVAAVFFDMKTGRGFRDARLIAAAPDLLGALKAEEEADASFDSADEYTHRAADEGWLNDPTGSCHVAEAWDRANKLRATAKELRRAAISKAEGR